MRRASLPLWTRAIILTIFGGCAKPPIRVTTTGALLPFPKPPTLFDESFDRLDLTRWREVEVKGRTQYAIELVDGNNALKARSHAGASILLYPLRSDPDTYPWASWRWRVDQTVEREDLRTKSGSDASARVYVYFDTKGLPWQKRNLDYVWSLNLPVGTILPSAFSKASMMIVVDSGREHLGVWRSVSRNIEEDYRRCFGGTAPHVVAIGIMTDTDNTTSDATAFYDDVMVTRQRPHEPVQPPS